MHHAFIPSQVLYLWLILIAGELVVGLRADNRCFLRIYLLGEAALGTALILIAKALPAKAYYYAWIAGTFLDEGLLALLLFGIINHVRKRGLTSRQSFAPIYFAAFVSLCLGIFSARYTLQELQGSIWRNLFGWDHCFLYAVCCMLLFLPLYSLVISGSSERSVFLTAIGMALYTIAHSGLLDYMVRHHSFRLQHAADFVYAVSLIIWLLAASNVKLNALQRIN